ncbi:hypothetical protein PROFUN_03302 [Planoprotostelium fungivorum]|uniref:HTH OST-type domain-containing protein n=1 Tax=Planoprotostelium fungivorum TaxID=1890364 RepID=A0A2P6NWX5_9EUKA|nr:hypothetical protein PROFUN_03302 [Planoprotostelium fungivorum]
MLMDDTSRQQFREWMIGQLTSFENNGILLGQIPKLIQGHYGQDFKYRNYYQKIIPFLQQTMGDTIAITGPAGGQKAYLKQFAPPTRPEYKQHMRHHNTRTHRGHSPTRQIAAKKQQQTQQQQSQQVQQPTSQENPVESVDASIGEENHRLRERVVELEEQLKAANATIDTLRKKLMSSEEQPEVRDRRLRERRKSVESIDQPLSTTSDSPPLFFLHGEVSTFVDVMQTVHTNHGIPHHMLERDYYITHAIWCLEAAGFIVHVKGGVSLSKGYHLIHRVSEDIDICLCPGNKLPHHIKLLLQDLGKEPEWLKRTVVDQKMATEQIKQRAGLFKRLFRYIQSRFVGFAKVEQAGGNSPFFNNRWQHLAVILHYNSVCSMDDLDTKLFPPYIVLEIGIYQENQTLVLPHQHVSFHSFIMEQFRSVLPYTVSVEDNQPTRVICTHPAITLLQKITDGISHRFPRPISPDVTQHYATGIGGLQPPFDPRIVRHYEDAYSVIQSVRGDPSLLPSVSPHPNLKGLLYSLVLNSMVRRRLSDESVPHLDPSLNFDVLGCDTSITDRLELLQRCQNQRRALQYGVNLPNVLECAETIRDWLEKEGL